MALWGDLVSEPANPPLFYHQQSSSGDFHEFGSGITLRDLFAAAALAVLARPLVEDDNFWPEDRARYAYKIADAMLAAREKKA